MARWFPLFTYKLRFFFGPAFRGRIGPFAYLGLISLFGLYGFLIGSGLGAGLNSSPAGRGANLLSVPLAGLMALGFLYSLGSGVTAHASEFDFFMTAPIRPREYLMADLIFQFGSLFAAGGAASVLAAVGIFLSFHQPLALVVPFLLIFLAYAGLVLMIIQLIVILGVRHPKFPLRSVILVLLALSLLPAISLAIPSFPITFQTLPIPSAAFASLGYSFLTGSPINLYELALAAIYLGAIGGTWYALSDTYIFHAIHPSLSAGFGQVDMAARMRQQQRLIGGFSRITKRVPLRADRGSDVGLMARLHLVRFLRDGSLLFLGIFGGVSLLISQTSGNTPGSSVGSTIAFTNVILLLVGILALNWSYYDRENLWVVVTSPKTAGPYFRGLMISLAAVGVVALTALFIVVYSIFPRPLSVSDLALPFTAQIGAAIIATTLLTRLRIKPAAFSLGMLALLFLPEVGGLIIGLVGEAVVLGIQGLLGSEPVVQAFVATGYAILAALVGLWIVGRLGKGFHI